MGVLRLVYEGCCMAGLAVGTLLGSPFLACWLVAQWWKQRGNTTELVERTRARILRDTDRGSE